MVTIIPSIISVLITTAFFGLLFGLIFWGIRAINRSLSSRRIRRKLSAAKMAGEQS
ncbi:MAG: hypothetical protein KGD64_06260 [Candidatus Heimdallarchaeota archaeon]|nr:hypothetical protein [Candidatus Heimdallarchaeota archaeon]